MKIRMAVDVKEYTVRTVVLLCCKCCSCFELQYTVLYCTTVYSSILLPYSIRYGTMHYLFLQYSSTSHSITCDA